MNKRKTVKKGQEKEEPKKWKRECWKYRKAEEKRKKKKKEARRHVKLEKWKIGCLNNRKTGNKGQGKMELKKWE